MKQQFSIKALVALVCGSAITFGAIAQNSQSTVIVSGSRFEENLNEVPANVKVITRDEIANSTSNNIPDVLSQIGGLNVRSTNGGQLNLDATVDMGGFGATANSTTLILVDGQRLNPIDSQGVSWESIPLDSIERIEIVQGGASVQYGNGAVGGVINIITNGGKKSINQATVNYGSFNTLINNAILRNTFDQTTVQLTANTSNSDGWRQNSAASAYSFDGKITQSLGGSDNIYADFYTSHTNAQQPGGVVGQVGSGNPQAAKFNNIGSASIGDNSGVRLGGTYALSNNYMAMLDASYGNRTISYGAPYYSTPDSIGGGFPGASNNHMQSWEFNLAPRVKGNFGKWGTTIVGYDFNQAGGDSNNSYSGAASQWIKDNPLWYLNSGTNQTAKVLNQSAYIISRVPLTSNTELSGGFRRQVQSTSTTDVTLYTPSASASQTYGANAGDVAINYSYARNQKIYLKWNQSFRFPNIDEYWGWSNITYERVFSGILKPQLTQSYEAGGEWGFDAVKLSTSIFQSITQNEIRYSPTTGYNSNSEDNISRKGILLDANFSITSKLNVAAGGKYQNSIYANGAYVNEAITLSPDLLLNARANYLINENWMLGGVINYVGSQIYDSDPSISPTLARMPAYTTADVYAGYRLGNWEAKLTVKNVGGSSYASTGGYGSTLVPGGTTANNYYYYPSDPRAYYLTAKYSFN
jgi:iron complex outermembrane receptor protein